MQPENLSTPVIAEGTLFNPDCRLSTPAVKHAFLLRCIAVAGHSAEFIEARIPALIQELTSGHFSASPIYAAAADLIRFRSLLMKYRLGQYDRLSRAMKDLAALAMHQEGLDKVTRTQLVEVTGIGMKTASFFLLYSRGDTVAVLDRHILRYLATIYPDITFPASPPASVQKYLEFERLFLEHCVEKGYDPIRHDFKIWDQARRKSSSGKTAG